MFGLSLELEATIVIGILAIIATIVAPIIWGRGRIEFLSQNCWQVDQTGGVKELTVNVYHGDQLVEGPVYVMLGGFTNTGRKDITRDHFVTPIKVNVPTGVEVISAQVSTPDQVGAVCEIQDNAVLLSWDMLKRNETVSVYIIVSAKGPRPGPLTSVPRLRDIQNGPIYWFGFFNPRGLTVSFAVTLLSLLVSISSILVAALIMKAHTK